MVIFEPWVSAGRPSRETFEPGSNVTIRSAGQSRTRFDSIARTEAGMQIDVSEQQSTKVDCLKTDTREPDSKVTS
jgi:hypothetical protein